MIIWEGGTMKRKRIKKLLSFPLLVLIIIIFGCSRYKYLDPPSKEIIDEEKEGIVYLDTGEEQEQLETIPTESSFVVKIEYGKASYYADKFQGKPTASGELYDRNKLTAAHRTLPFGTSCRVTNTANKKTVIVRINDRGPHVKGRIIDLSYQAMRLLDGIRAGEIDVMVEVLK
jgi:rare lipoprotein A